MKNKQLTHGAQNCEHRNIYMYTELVDNAVTHFKIFIQFVVFIARTEQTVVFFNGSKQVENLSDVMAKPSVCLSDGLFVCLSQTRRVQKR